MLARPSTDSYVLTRCKLLNALGDSESRPGTRQTWITVCDGNALLAEHGTRPLHGNGALDAAKLTPLKP